MAIDLAGLKIGHATHEQHHTGCTVILCPDGTVGSAEIRGGGPATREMALLALDKHMAQVNAVVLSGGSAFGLATADGVVRYLAERGIGYQTPLRPVPIVPAACLFDLFMTGGEVLLTAESGYAACLAASDTEVAQGNVGAGAGATIGKWNGPDYFMKGGFGHASVTVDGTVIGAVAAVNAIGDVIDADGTVLAGARDAAGGWMADEKPFRPFARLSPAELTNTTLVVTYTNATLTKMQVFRLAQRAHDGMALAIRPAHTTHDGDTAFALATRQVEGDYELVANATVEMVAEAIRNAARHAATVGSIPGLAG